MKELWRLLLSLFPLNKGGGLDCSLGRVQQPESFLAERRAAHNGITFQMQGQRLGKDKGKRVRKLNVARNGFSPSAA